MSAGAPLRFQVDWNACIRCGVCVAVCPQKAGFTTPFDTIAVDTPCEIACLWCEEACPVSAISHDGVDEQKSAPESEPNSRSGIN